MRFLLTSALAIAAAVGSAQSFVKAQFIFFRSQDGKTVYNPPRQLTLTDKAELAKIPKLLPGLGLSKGGLKAGGWDAWGTLRLIRAKGPGMQVFFRADGKVISMVGKQGDFPAGKGFLEFLTDIEGRAKQ